MTEAFTHEFKTVDLILATDSTTKGVDAFALTQIKLERQLRKLFTHLAFQSPQFHVGNIQELRDALSENAGVFFEGLERGFHEISPLSLRDLVGEGHGRLRDRVSESIRHRNKIFHGQLTRLSL